MVDWWTGLPGWLRFVFGLVVMLLGGGILWAGLTGRIIAGRRACSTLALALIGLGFAMMLIGGKSDSERNGYHF